jgi:VWFA-related protein
MTAAGQQSAAPISVGIVFDTSGSMGAKLQRSRQVAAEFLKAAGPQDEFFLLEFNDRAVLMDALSTDTYKMRDHLVLTRSKGRSALWDAVTAACSEIKKAQNSRKALIVISDGGDNSSRSTEDQVSRLMREGGVPVYAFGVMEALPGRTAGSMQAPFHRLFLA